MDFSKNSMSSNSFINRIKAAKKFSLSAFINQKSKEVETPKRKETPAHEDDVEDVEDAEDYRYGTINDS